MNYELGTHCYPVLIWGLVSKEDCNWVRNQWGMLSDSFLFDLTVGLLVTLFSNLKKTLI